MKLSVLTDKVNGAKFSGNCDPEIQTLCYDSRTVSEGALFFALSGQNADGKDYIKSAVRSGASGVVAEVHDYRINVPWIKVSDGRAVMSAMSDAFYGYPSRKMKVAGVTGTNGKTTTAFLLYHLLEKAQRRCGLLGTVRYELGGEEDPEVTHTTPESPELQAYLSKMIESGCVAAVMEVSSHGLDQKRAADVRFDVGVFTNLSRDHLDYHGNMTTYFKAKRRLFEQIADCDEKPKAIAVVDYDDVWGKKLLADLPRGHIEAVTFGLGVGADYRAMDLCHTRAGTEFKLEVGKRQFRAKIPLFGRFNVYNALAALAAGVGMGLNLRETVSNLAELPQIPGRLESVSEGRAFDVFVDYAHSPDAMQNAITSLNELNPRRMIVVFGCGGNRDVPKRGQMGAVASRLANYVIITSDNPRCEDPQEIIKDIESGFDGDHYEIVVDRREAIALGVSYLLPGDILLIAGKGHEGYQQFADHRIDFDDRQVARQMLSDRDSVRADMVREKREEYEKRKLNEQGEKLPGGRSDVNEG